MYSICTFQVFLVLFQWINIVARKSDKTRSRFLMLSAVYLIFNITWISLLESLSFSTWREIPSIGYLAILMVGYTYYYILQEMGNVGSLNKALRLVFSLSVVYFLQEISREYFSESFDQYFAIALSLILQGLTIVLLLRTARPIIRTRIRHGSISPIYTAILIVACVYCFAPLLFGLVQESSLEFVLINVPFLILSGAYILHYLNQSKSESVLLNTQTNGDTLNQRYIKIKKRIDEIGLTERQLEVAKLILLGYSYKSIAKNLFLTEPSARKHASNIFKKSGVSSLSEFKQSFYFDSDKNTK